MIGTEARQCPLRGLSKETTVFERPPGRADSLLIVGWLSARFTPAMSSIRTEEASPYAAARRRGVAPLLAPRFQCRRIVMVAYLVALGRVHKPEVLPEHERHTPAVVAAFGGRYLVRGGTMETLAGDIEDRRAVVVEFPDMDRARAFYESPGYQDARKHLGDAITADMFLLEGFEPDRAPHSGS